MSAGVVVDSAKVAGFAETVISFIRQDIVAGFVPPSVQRFSDLHLFVDANMYLEDAGQVYVADDSHSLAEINAVTDAVNVLIRDGALVGEELDCWRARMLYGSTFRARQLAAVVKHGRILYPKVQLLQELNRGRAHFPDEVMFEDVLAAATA